MNPLVSIIIPVYNVTLFLNKCIDSVINQTYKNLEIICINDGSTDNSLDILKSYTDERIQIIDIENHGVSYARNLGIEKATGEYLLFVDSDDYIEKTMVEELISLMSDEVDLAYCGLRYVRLSGFVKKTWIPAISETDRPVSDRFKITQYLTVTKKAFKRSIIEENQLRFDNSLHYSEDSLFLVQYLTHCKKAKGIKKILYNIVTNGLSLSRNPAYKERQKIEKMKSFKMINEITKDYDNKTTKIIILPDGTRKIV